MLKKKERERSSVHVNLGKRIAVRARFEMCYYKMGYAARKESRVQQPTRTVNRGAQAGSENDIAVVRDSTAYVEEVLGRERRGQKERADRRASRSTSTTAVVCRSRVPIESWLATYGLTSITTTRERRSALARHVASTAPGQPSSVSTCTFAKRYALLCCRTTFK